MQGTRAEPGIIPRAVEVRAISPYLLNRIVGSYTSQALFDRQYGLQRYQSSLSVSYMEIYKDEVYDLLVNRDNVRIEFEYQKLSYIFLTGPETASPRE
jgi:kinesin family member 22